VTSFSPSYRYSGCSIFEQQRLPRCRPILLLKPRGRQALLTLSLSHNPTEDGTEKKREQRQLLAPAEGIGAKVPFCLPLPRSARSLSHGRVVCTCSLDTIRSTTLTRETVTATLVLLPPGWISHRNAKFFLFGIASIGSGGAGLHRPSRATIALSRTGSRRQANNRHVAPRQSATAASCHAAEAGASSRS